MFRYKTILSMSVSVLVALGSTAMARAERIEVFQSLVVTKHSYDAPLNEQPFYGFMPKAEAMLAADRKLIEAVKKNTGLEVGADQFDAMGWEAVKNGDLATAAKRFNQAWLLDPGRSSSVHGMAIVASERFGDFDFAIELANAAAGLKRPLPALPGDQGGLLVKAGKPDQAIPVLEKAVVATPDWINPQINLATAKLDLGDVRGACDNLEKVDRMLQARAVRPAKMDGLYRSLADKAHCGSL